MESNRKAGGSTPRAYRSTQVPRTLRGAETIAKNVQEPIENMTENLQNIQNINKNREKQSSFTVIGTPDAIRTHDLQSRSLTLYPAELRAHLLGASSNITDLTVNFKCKSDFSENYLSISLLIF